MQIDVNKYIRYQNTLKEIKEARNCDYNTFKKMVIDLQKKATKALEG